MRKQMITMMKGIYIIIAVLLGLLLLFAVWCYYRDWSIKKKEALKLKEYMSVIEGMGTKIFKLKIKLFPLEEKITKFPYRDDKNLTYKEKVLYRTLQEEIRLLEKEQYKLSLTLYNHEKKKLDLFMKDRIG